MTDVTDIFSFSAIMQKADVNRNLSAPLMTRMSEALADMDQNVWEQQFDISWDEGSGERLSCNAGAETDYHVFQIDPAVWQPANSNQNEVDATIQPLWAVQPFT